MNKRTEPNAGEVGLSDFAPDFSLASLGSGEIRLSDFRGWRVAIFFWASW